jgi:hypothetical protein
MKQRASMHNDPRSERTLVNEIIALDSDTTRAAMFEATAGSPLLLTVAQDS